MRLGATTPPTVVPGSSTQGDISETDFDAAAQDIENDYAAIGVSPTRQDYQDAGGLVRSRRGPNSSPYAGPIAPAAASSSSTSSSSSSSILLYGGIAAGVVGLLFVLRKK